MASVWKKTAPKIWSKVIHSKTKKHPDTKVATAEATAEYRRKFLDGLKFYCESPSLILNSDLPADLIEYVTSQGFPIEALGIILEAKKLGALSSSHSGTRGDSRHTDTVKFSEISRKLVEEWMTSDSCSEAFVSLSIGEEIPGILAETSNFQRILFTIVDVFHLNGQEFLRFLLQQCLLTLVTLTHAVREDAVIKVRSQPISTFLDRIFLRFHSDSEHFRPDLMPVEHISNNPFADFCSNLRNEFENDFIGKRLLMKTFLSLGNTAAIKISKTLLLIGKKDKCAIKSLLQPSEQVLSENSVWKHALLINIPFKTATKSPFFWSNWANFIYSEGSSSVKIEIWSECVQNWTSLCNNTYIESKVLIPASYALISLAKEVKSEKSDLSSGNEEEKSVFPPLGDIFGSITKCLDSTDDAKRSCGMAVAQIVAELHFPKKSEEFTKLEFESQSAVFKELINYYNDENIWLNVASKDMKEMNTGKDENETQIVNILQKPIKVLDSDDEDEPEENEDPDNIPDLSENPEEATSEEFPVDERLQSLRLTGKRIPKYFSEITECLIGDGRSRDEAEKEALKEVSILKISVLLSYGVRIDANMASLLSKMLIEMEGGRMFELPIIFALYEISSIHPYEVYGTLAALTFDKEHHSVGQRMVILSRCSEIVQLISRQKCFLCYSALLDPLYRDLCSLSPDFMTSYYENRKNLRHCKTCTQNQRAIEPTQSFNSVVHLEKDTAVSVKDDLTKLTWKEIVDRRVAAKTRYFAKPKIKSILIPDEYSAKLVPIIWSSLANRLDSRKEFFLASNAVEKPTGFALNDMLLAQVFRVLGRIVVGTAGPHCAHLRNISAQVGNLVSTFIDHNDRLVRRAVLALLAITLTTGEGKPFIIEAVTSQEDLVEKLRLLAKRETDPENAELFSNTIAYIVVTRSGLLGSGLQ